VQVEGGSDRHAIMIDEGTCVLYELFAVRRNGGGSDRRERRDLRPRLERAPTGRLDGRVHAPELRLACATPGGRRNPACPPMGARFRLRVGYDIRGYSPSAQIVLRAMKRNGMIVADNGSDWYFQGTVDPRWGYSFVDQLKRVPASAFIAVDASACRAVRNSGAFAHGPGCPAP
jgi:hypothetical protein